MMRLLWVLLAVVGLLLTRPAAALEIEVAPDSTIDLGDRVELFRDPAGLRAEDAARVRFSASTARYPNLGFTADTVWVRFALRNGASDTAHLALDVGREWLEEVDLHELRGDEVGPASASGARVPVLERPLRVDRVAFPIDLAGGESRSFLLRVRSRSPIDLALSLSPAREYLAEAVTGTLMLGGYYGVLVAIAISNLVLFSMLRDPLQPAVALLLVGWAYLEMCGHGHLSRLVPSGAGSWEITGMASGFVVATGASLWIAHRLWFGADERWRARWMIASAATAATALLGMVYLPLALVGGLGALASVLVASVVAAREHVPGARYATAAFGLFAAGGTATTATLVGLLPAWPANEYAVHGGTVSMSVLLSLLVADSIRSARARVEALQADAQALNEELRFQVEARSRQLVDVLARGGAASSDAPIHEGDVFESRYRVEAFLGEGGMGSVHAVKRLTDGKRFALKVVTSASTGVEAARIAREAEIGSRLTHPNLVRIHDVGVARQGPYLVMELVDGGSLEGHEERWGDLAWAVPKLRGVVRALAALHAANVVHRDLKPENVLLDGDTPKVADFGIARMFDPRQDPAPAALADTIDVHAMTTQARLTSTHAVLGTPLYMGPEAALGAQYVGPPYDVFAFGVLALELLTGQHPFDEVPILAALAGRPHPKHREPVGLPQTLATVLVACLAAAPAARPTLDELDRALRDTSPSPAR